MKKLLLLLLLCLPSTARANVPCIMPFTLTNGTLADATQVMANFNAAVACLTNAAAAGANSDITSLSGLTTALSPSQGGSSQFIGGTSTGSATAQIVATTTPNTFTLTQGYRVTFLAGFAAGSGMTLNVNGTGAKNVLKRAVTPAGLTGIVSGDYIAAEQLDVIYDGTQFQLMNVPGSTFGTFTTIGTGAGPLNAQKGMLTYTGVTINAATAVNFTLTADNQINASSACTASLGPISFASLAGALPVLSGVSPTSTGLTFTVLNASASIPATSLTWVIYFNCFH